MLLRRVLDRDLEMAVDHLADMLQHSLIRAADVEAERQVILEEINMREDSPDDVIHDLFAETLWPDHPLGRPVLGTRGDDPRGDARTRCGASTGGTTCRAISWWRRPETSRHEELVRLLTNRMDTGAARRPGDPGVAPPRGATARRRPRAEPLVKRRKTEQAHICLGTNGLSRNDPDRFAFLIVNTALGGGMSSRLFQEIREKRGLAYSVVQLSRAVRRDRPVLAPTRARPRRGARGPVAAPREQSRRSREGPDRGGVRAREGTHEGLVVLSLEDPAAA